MSNLKTTEMKRFLTSLKTALVAVAMVTIFAFQGQAQDYNRLGLSYELEFLNPKYGDNTNLNSFGVGYLHGFGLSSSVPIYLETGLKMTAGFWGESEEDSDEKYSVNIQKLSFAVPVNVAYRFNVGNGLSIQPYLGLNLKLNALLQTKETYSEEGYDDEKETYNWLKGDDAASVFQLGWHVGAGLNYHWLYFGLSYGTDFIKLNTHKDASINSSTFNVTVGYNF